MGSPRLYLENKRFGYLLVIGRSHKDRHHKWHWKCICDCGQEVSVEGSRLVKYETQSCGCYQRKRASEANFKHGYGNTRNPLDNTYSIWTGMKARCKNPNHKSYPDYGGRGIKVCEHWEDFFNFLCDMGHAPSPQHTLDRIEVNGNYEKANCKWSTRSEQNLNKRSKEEPLNIDLAIETLQLNED